MVDWFSGTGKGGQKRNKSQTSCRVKHIPTGFIETRQGRSRIQNFNDAKEALIKKLDDYINEKNYIIISNVKRKQVGSGMRGDKIRTIRFQDDQVINHKNNKTMSAKKYMKGFINEIWS